MSQTIASSERHLRAEITGNIATVLIDNPVRRNAFNTDMWRAVGEIVKAVEATGEARVMILRGAGDEPFSTGADISEFAEKRDSADAARAYDAVTEAAYDAIRRSPIPSIAMIREFCLGGGLGLALACDMRLADEDAKFSIPAARLGLAYPLASLRQLVAVAGPDTARDLLFTARRIDAAEALRLGLINRVLPASELADKTLELALEISRNAPLTISCAKATINDALHAAAAEPSAELEALARACYESGDYAEGRAAFLEKRKPQFTGK